MLKDIVRVEPLDGHRLEIEFEDGLKGVVDVGELVPFEGVFEPLKDRQYFESVKVDRELGIIYWPNGSDLDPDVLYARISGEPIPEFDKLNHPVA